MKRIFQNLLIVITTLFILCIILEISLRAYHSFKEGVSFLGGVNIGNRIVDPLLSWRGKEVMGDIHSPKYKIFFVGDSYTDGSGVRIEDMYYYSIKKKLDAEIFVYGGSGYGTLQEYLVIDKYIDTIKPDLVVLQVHENDFLENVWGLDNTIIKIRQYPRPYYKNGRIEYRFPKRFYPLRHLQPHFYFINFILVRMDKALTLPSLLKVLSELKEKGLESPRFQESVLVTSTLVGKIKRRLNGIPLLAFAVTDSKPFLSQFRIIFRSKDIEFIDDIPKIIRKSEAKGVRCWLENTHWNENGHRICADHLVNYIDRKSLLAVGMKN